MRFPSEIHRQDNDNGSGSFRSGRLTAVQDADGNLTQFRPQCDQ